MAIIVHVNGPAKIQIDDYTGPGLQSLGYTRDGAEIAEETFRTDVPGDERAGEQGPPVEIQYNGEIHRVRLELTKWDDTPMNIIRANVPAGTAGAPYAVAPTGTLLFANNKFFRLLILGSTIGSGSGEPRNYPCAIPVGQPREVNKGSRFSTQVVEFECHAYPPTGSLAGSPNNLANILWNTTTS